MTEAWDKSGPATCGTVVTDLIQDYSRVKFSTEMYIVCQNSLFRDHRDFP